MPKLRLIVKANDPAGISHITRQFYGAARDIPLAIQGATVAVLARDAVAIEQVPALDVPVFDAILELAVSDGGDTDALVEIGIDAAASIADHVDPKESIAIVGNEHILTTGDGPFEFVRAFGRKSDISLQQFKDHFLNIHSQFATTNPSRPPYRQLHRDESATARLREATGFTEREIDGLAILRLYGAEAMAKLSMGPDHAAAATADGGLFIDPDTRRTSFASVVLLAGPLL